MPLPQQFTLLVLGQGGTGLELASWAASHLGERVTSVTVYGGASSAPTERATALETAGVAFVYGTEEVAGTFDICVASPGISEFCEFFRSARAASSQIMGEPEFAWLLSPERWCAITGTNGKTTVTSLTDELLRASGLDSVAVGNIGNAPIHEVDRREEGEWFVAELSSYQLATTEAFHPRVAVLLNLSPDHLAWHRSHENYALAKIRMFKNMDDGDIAIVNIEDEGLAPYLDRICDVGRRVLHLGLADDGAADAAFVRDGVLTVRMAGAEHALVRVDELRIVGAHNVLNALAASAAALACGASVAGVCSGLREFKPLPHRLEPVDTVDGVRYVNDSKATNTDAVLTALAAFDGARIVLLLGGSDKGTPLEEFMAEVASRVACVVCFGEARERLRTALMDAPGATDIDIAEAEDLRDAVDVARSLAQRGDTVLLSPACASFDEFSGFEERGEAFRSYVADLAALSEAEA